MQQHQLTPFGLMVQKALLEKDMTQVELAEQVGTSKNFLSMILHGRRPGGKYISEIEKICSSKHPVKRKEGRRRVKWHELTPLGCMVIKALEEKGMTQVELAKELGTTKQYLNLILHGKRSPGKYLSEIVRICNIDLKDVTEKSDD